MGTLLSRWTGAALAVVTAASVAACGSGGSSSTAAHSASSTSTPAASASATSATTPPQTSATSATTPPQASATSATTPPQASAASLPAGCTSPHTSTSIGQVGAATGHIGVTLLFRNSGAAACTLTGYPGVALVAATGRHGELQVARTAQGYMGGLSPQARANPVVILAPGQSGSAILEGEDFDPVTSGSCPRYSSLLVTPPNQRVTVRLTRSLSMCDPTVHPVVSGTTGRQAP